MRIGIPKERREHEQRVAASPDTVKRYKGLGLDPVVERGAGQGAAIPDQAFADAGATLVDGPDEVWASDIVLKVRPPTDEETGRLRQGQILIGMLEPYTSREQLERVRREGCQGLRAGAAAAHHARAGMDVLSSQANIAGYKAVIVAPARLQRFMPMLMTAAGTVKAARSSSSAPAWPACRRSPPPSAWAPWSRRPTCGRPARSRSSRSAPSSSTCRSRRGAAAEGAAATRGRCRRRSRPSRPQLVAERVKGRHRHHHRADPGPPGAACSSPRRWCAAMKPGSVIVDLAAEQGGNVEGSRGRARRSMKHGVTIVGAYQSCQRGVAAASALYARNLLDFLKLAGRREGRQLKIDLQRRHRRGTPADPGRPARARGAQGAA